MIPTAPIDITISTYLRRMASLLSSDTLAFAKSRKCRSVSNCPGFAREFGRFLTRPPTAAPPEPESVVLITKVRGFNRVQRFRGAEGQRAKLKAAELKSP